MTGLASYPDMGVTVAGSIDRLSRSSRRESRRDSRVPSFNGGLFIRLSAKKIVDPRSNTSINPRFPRSLFLLSLIELSSIRSASCFSIVTPNEKSAKEDAIIDTIVRIIPHPLYCTSNPVDDYRTSERTRK